MNIGILFFFFPFLVWAIGIGAIMLAVKGNFKRANRRSANSVPRHSRQTGRSFSKPQPTVRMSARRPQVEKGLLDMDLSREKKTKEKKGISFGSFRNTGYDTYETKGRRKDLVTGYNRKIKGSRQRMRRARGMQYSHTYDGHEPWDKCLPKEKDPWDPDFYA